MSILLGGLGAVGAAIACRLLWRMWSARVERAALWPIDIDGTDGEAAHRHGLIGWSAAGAVAGIVLGLWISHRDRVRPENAARASTASAAEPGVDAELAHGVTNAALWAKLASDATEPDDAMAIARQGIAVAAESRQRHELVRAMTSDACELEAAKLELGDRTSRDSACAERSYGRAGFRLADPRVDAGVAGQPARARIDLRVGTTAITAALASRAGIRPQGTPSLILLDGKVVRGTLAVATDVAVAGSGTLQLAVLVVASLPGDLDAVIGINYLWRFDQTTTARDLRLEPRAL